MQQNKKTEKFKNSGWNGLHGGAWNYGCPSNFRCAHRFYNTPDDYLDNSGFRSAIFLDSETIHECGQSPLERLRRIK